MSRYAKSGCTASVVPGESGGVDAQGLFLAELAVSKNCEGYGLLGDGGYHGSENIPMGKNALRVNLFRLSDAEISSIRHMLKGTNVRVTVAERDEDVSYDHPVLILEVDLERQGS